MELLSSSDFCSMTLGHYELKVDREALTYRFVSIGTKGKIKKLIQFSLIDEDGFYNLSFGDMNSGTGEIDDLITTDNGDSEKVLATVVSAVYAFCDLIPQAWIYATGSTAARTRLYRMGINRYFDAAQEDFIIFGQLQDDWEFYIKGKDYRAFLVQKKSYI